ncbi:MAG: MG2 domain-containing protein [Fimbriimonas sp.]
MRERALVLARVLALLVAVVTTFAVLALGVAKDVPRGGLAGRLTMSENGRPLPRATIDISPIGATFVEGGSLPEDSYQFHSADTDSDGNFKFGGLPTGFYRLSTSARYHNSKDIIVEVTEGKVTEKTIVAKPSDPSLQIYASQKNVTPSETAKIEVHGFSQDSKLSVEFRRLDWDAVARSGSMRNALSPLAQKPALVAKTGIVARTVDLDLKAKDIEGAYVQPFEVAPLEEGLYWVEFKGKAIRQGTYLNVTRTAVVSKLSPTGGLVFVTELESGKPVPNAKLSFEVQGKSKDLGVSGPDGTLPVTIDRSEGGVLMAKSGASTAIIDYYAQGNDTSEWKVFTYTDRPVYRPGDTAQFKTIIRRTHIDGTYSLPQARTATVEINDADGSLVEKFEVPVDTHGTLHGSFRTSKEAKPGSYGIKVTAGEASDTYWVPFAAYRKPEFTVDVKPEKPTLILGEQAVANIECRTYFGAAVPGAKVTVAVYRSSVWEDPESDDYYDETYGEYLDSIETVTDANGRARVQVATVREGEKFFPTNDSSFKFEVTVNENDRYISGQGSIKVIRGSISVKPKFDETFVPEGKSVSVGASVRTHEGDKPFANQDVIFELVKRSWKDNPESSSEQVEEILSKTTVKTDSEGLAQTEIKPPTAGSFVVRMGARDESGRLVIAERAIYADGVNADYADTNASISLTLDKYKANPGEKVKALIQTLTPGGSALVTVQSNRIIRHYVVPLSKASNVLEIPIDREAIPNAFVSVAYVRAKQFAGASKRVLVETRLNELQVTVKADQTKYKPGDQVGLEVLTLGPDGKPVSADVSVGVVDEAIYAIKPDTTDIVADFYPIQYDQVETSYSFPEVYLDGGDKGGANVQIRRNFQDTATWIPNVRTGADGKARVSFKLPDNLTTWRATAIATTDDTKVGMSKGTFLVAKDLNVRIQAPVYLVRDDQRRLAVVLNNETDKDLEVNFEIAPEGVKLEGDLKGKRTIAAKGSTSLDYGIVTLLDPKAVITAKAWVVGGPNDGVEGKFPIQPNAEPFRWSRTLQANPSAVADLPELAPGKDRGGVLTVTVSPSIASTMLQSLDSLVDFPYGCVEQTMSRFLPAILVGSTLKELGIKQPKLQAKIPLIAADGFARLKKMQHDDGGWGWWEYDESDPFMTALVLDGLARAKADGYEGDLKVKSALEWAAKYKPAKVEPWQRANIAYLGSVLARYGDRKNAQRLMDAAGKPDTLTLHALRVMTLVSLGQPASKALGDLKTSLGTPKRNDDWSWGTEPQALALTALLSIDPKDPEVAPLVAKIMLERRGDSWASTRDTSYVLIGLTKYLAATGEAKPQGTVRVLVNQKVVRTIELTPQSIFDPNLVVEIPGSELETQNRVEVQTETPTPVYASIAFNGYRPPTEAPTKDFTIRQQFYGLESRRQENGKLAIESTPKPVLAFKKGDVFRSEIEIFTTKRREFLLVEAYTPSNCQVVERENAGPDEQWGWWYSSLTIRDDRVAFFVRDLAPGTHKLVFHLRAESPGKCTVLGAQVSNMYDSDEATHTVPTYIEVRQ